MEPSSTLKTTPPPPERAGLMIRAYEPLVSLQKRPFTWRIIPFSKWLVTPILFISHLGHLEGE